MDSADMVIKKYVSLLDTACDCAMNGHFAAALDMQTRAATVHDLVQGLGFKDVADRMLVAAKDSVKARAFASMTKAYLAATTPRPPGRPSRAALEARALIAETKTREAHLARKPRRRAKKAKPDAAHRVGHPPKPLATLKKST